MNSAQWMSTQLRTSPTTGRLPRCVTGLLKPTVIDWSSSGPDMPDHASYASGVVTRTSMWSPSRRGSNTTNPDAVRWF